MHPELPASVVQRDPQYRFTECGAYGSRGLGRSEGKRKQSLDNATTFHEGFSQSVDQSIVAAFKHIPTDARMESTSRSLAEPVLSGDSRESSQSEPGPLDLNVELGLDGKPLKKPRRDDHGPTGLKDHDPICSGRGGTTKPDAFVSKATSQAKVHQLAQGSRPGQTHPVLSRNVPPTTESQGDFKFRKWLREIESKCYRDQKHSTEFGGKLMRISHQQWSEQDLEKPNFCLDRVARLVTKTIPRRILTHFVQPFSEKLRDAICEAKEGLTKKKTGLKNVNQAELDVGLVESNSDDKFAYIVEENLNVAEGSCLKQCDALFSWLQLEIFECTDLPPIIGRILGTHLNFDAKQLRPVQKMLIKFLCLKKIGGESYYYSTFLVGIWYKTFHEEIWKEVFANDDQLFWMYMTNQMHDPINTLQLMNWDTFLQIIPVLHGLGTFRILGIDELVGKKHHQLLKNLLSQNCNVIGWKAQLGAAESKMFGNI